LHTNGEGEFLAQKEELEGLRGFYFEGDGNGFESCVPWLWVKSYDVYITTYYGAWERSRATPFQYFLGFLTFRAQRELIQDSISEKIFNRKKLFRGDRMFVLRIIIQEYLEDNNFSSSATGILQKIYGFRWLRHPDNKETMRYYSLILRSLEASGDLAANDGRYTLASKALWSIASYEEENRRHRDSIRIQWTLAFLTGGLIIVGLIQAGVSAGFFS
jgi:hypothetical protein